MTRSAKLVVDPIACRAHGLCAEMLPDLVRLDEWGYPIIASDPVAPHRRSDARAALRACPTLALRLRRSAPRFVVAQTAADDPRKL